MNIDREYRYCYFCLKRNVYVIEDEFHFVLVCPLYDELRHKYLMDIIGNQYITLNLFYTMMSEYNRKSVIAMAKYIYDAFTTRKTFLLDT